MGRDESRRAKGMCMGREAAHLLVEDAEEEVRAVRLQGVWRPPAAGLTTCGAQGLAVDVSWQACEDRCVGRCVYLGVQSSQDTSQSSDRTLHSLPPGHFTACYEGGKDILGSSCGARLTADG